jgi:hypothetical protein
MKTVTITVLFTEAEFRVLQEIAQKQGKEAEGFLAEILAKPLAEEVFVDVHNDDQAIFTHVE